MYQAEPTPPTTSSLAILAIVFSVLMCLPFFPLVGAILGLVALLRIRKNPSLKGEGLAIAAMVVGSFLMVANVGVLAAIAIPNYIKFQGRAKQMECKHNLKRLHDAQRSHWAEHNAYSTSFAALDFEPARRNHYTYFAHDSGAIADRSNEVAELDETHTGIGVDRFQYPHATSVRVSDILQFVRPGLDGDEMTIVCAGNLDGDADLDVWSISTGQRITEDGTPVPAGEPFHHFDDI